MKEKLKRMFRAIADGIGMLVICPSDDRRMPLYGGGFEQDRKNLQGDAKMVASDMGNAIRRDMQRMEG